MWIPVDMMHVNDILQEVHIMTLPTAGQLYYVDNSTGTRIVARINTCPYAVLVSTQSGHAQYLAHQSNSYEYGSLYASFHFPLYDGIAIHRWMLLLSTST
jgi:hypothetical protein